MKIITDERCTSYSRPGHPERPSRISGTLARLRSQSEMALSWAEPTEAKDAPILRAHSPELLASLDKPYDFDADTPYYLEIAAHARRSVGGALEALKSARAGEPAFSLMRPPGHHATRNQAMGFCYLNSIAIATLEAHATGAKRVAVYDFDVHHGNGTEAILKDTPGAAFFSIHQFPCYPGTGSKNVGNNCFNFPVAPGTPRMEYRRILTEALEGLKRFEPDIIAVSAGFDAYARDPLANGTLEAEDYFWLGESFRKLGIPFFSILEGGYSDDLPELIFAYLKGIDGK
ncbi:histone deacetylase family protein [Pedosphaera parvula]|uniref:Histone deacetylase superfamily n=1 Tax=Pedosphaera parvula (strain Ellin514) TaxID=320771 RepID=B9XE21_PEDPL|nr:histone deacetylase [Pedosphaera parvula]EEF61912.1 histone deacetylase superfamily [Pedosphaera parvula Ellin514]